MDTIIDLLPSLPGIFVPWALHSISKDDCASVFQMEPEMLIEPDTLPKPRSTDFCGEQQYLFQGTKHSAEAVQSNRPETHSPLPANLFLSASPSSDTEANLLRACEGIISTEEPRTPMAPVSQNALGFSPTDLHVSDSFSKNKKRKKKRKERKRIKNREKNS